MAEPNPMTGAVLTGVIDEIETGLRDHETVLTALEDSLDKHALRAAASVDPTRLLAMRDKIKGHTDRLSALLLKFPIIP